MAGRSGKSQSAAKAALAAGAKLPTREPPVGAG